MGSARNYIVDKTNVWSTAKGVARIAVRSSVTEVVAGSVIRRFSKVRLLMVLIACMPSRVRRACRFYSYISECDETGIVKPDNIVVGTGWRKS
jgi:hypothetical protein